MASTADDAARDLEVLLLAMGKQVRTIGRLLKEVDALREAVDVLERQKAAVEAEAEVLRAALDFSSLQAARKLPN